MTDFIEGEDRTQSTLFPERLDDYIAEDNLAAAGAFLANLKERFGLLAEQPLIGRERSDIHPDLRGFPFGRYVILYRVLTEEVEIVTVIHGARDIENLF